MRRGFTLIEALTFLAVISCVLCLIAPAVQRSRMANAQTNCRNNLKQIGLALHNYHDVHRLFPPGWVSSHYGPQSGSGFGWQTMILPQIEQYALYEEFDFENPADVPRELAEAMLAVYRCPADTTPERNPVRGGYATSNYSGNFGPTAAPRLVSGRLSASWPGHAETPRRTSGIFWCNSSTGIREIVDGTSNTLMVGERCFSSRAGLWIGVGSNHFEDDAVSDTSHANRLNHGLNSFSSVHGPPGSRVVQFLSCDGAVHALSTAIDSSADPENPGLLQVISGRNDGRIGQINE